MKRFFQWAVVLCIGLAAVPAAAQVDEAAAVIERYERETGLDELSAADMTSVMMELETEIQDMSVPMKMVLKEPGKISVDMEIAGQKMKMTIDGKNGWISVPGQGTMPMPDEMLKQLEEQSHISQNYRWNKKDFTYKMVGKVTEKDHTYVGVQTIPHKPQPQISDMIVYFDETTGLVAYMTMKVESGGQKKPFRMDFSDYKTFGKLKLPSLYRAIVEGSPMMVMRIKTLEYNYPVTDALFAKPE